MSDEGEKTCPLCAEEMDLTDQQLKPCKCGYQMGFLHFSHPHLLFMDEVQPAAGATQAAHCTGCKSPCSVGPIFGCVQCNPSFLMHEECFLAPRYVDHPLHPPHPLTLLPSPTYSTGSFLCNICNEPGSGFCFACSRCDFDLHVKCASLLPEQVTRAIQPPREVRHTPHHAVSSVIARRDLLCRACGLELGDQNAVHCGDCDIDLHFECSTTLRRFVNRKDHVHPFVLHEAIGSLDSSWLFICDVCHDDPPIRDQMWMYWCQECGIGCHVKCVANSQTCPESVLSLTASSSSTLTDHGSNLVQMINLKNQLSQLQFQTNVNAMSVLSHSSNAYSALQTTMTDNLKYSI